MNHAPRTPLALLFAHLVACGCGDQPTHEETRSVSLEDYDAQTASTGLDDEACSVLCDARLVVGCELAESQPEHEVVLICEVGDDVVCGRRHACWNLPSAPPTTVQGWLAHAAGAELGSAWSFRALADELRSHAAPEELVGACLDAAYDEERHALATSWAAGSIVWPSPHPAPTRSLLDLALENAREGCVAETWAALRAHWQAKHAIPGLRPLFSAIAADETRHSELAWALHDWFLTQLSAEDGQLVRSALRQAAQSLRAEPAPPPLGCPEPKESGALMAGLAHRWNAA